MDEGNKYGKLRKLDLIRPRSIILCLLETVTDLPHTTAVNLPVTVTAQPAQSASFSEVNVYVHVIFITGV